MPAPLEKQKKKRTKKKKEQTTPDLDDDDEVLVAAMQEVAMQLEHSVQRELCVEQVFWSACSFVAGM